MQPREQIIEKGIFFPRFSHSGGTSVSSADFVVLNSLERKLCNIAFPLSSVLRQYSFTVFSFVSLRWVEVLPAGLSQ